MTLAPLATVRAVDALLVIANRDAGPEETEQLTAGLEVLRSAASAELAVTSEPGELDGVLHRAGSRRIVVAGGDGTVHAVIAALHRRHELAGRVIGLLPLGTGNDFARAQGIPLDVAEAARLVLTADPRPADLVVDERGAVVINHVHVGAGAEAARHAAAWKQRVGSVGVGGLTLRRLGYPLGVVRTAVRPPRLRLRVEVDGTVLNDVHQQVLMVAIGNGPSVGGGTELTPGADPGDGLLDVVVSRAVGPLARVTYVAGLVRGRHEEQDPVAAVRGRSVTVCGEAFWCSADGELDGPERSRTWHVEPAAYAVLAPPR